MRRLLNSTPLLVFISIIIALYFSLKPSHSKYEHQLTSSQLTLLNGESFNLSQLHGQFYILHFFASWCEACKNDFVFLHEIKDQTHIPVIGIAINDNSGKLKALNKTAWPYDHIALDIDLKLAKLIQSRAIPQTILINPEGKIALSYLGGLSKEMIDKNIISKILKKE